MTFSNVFFKDLAPSSDWWKSSLFHLMSCDHTFDKSKTSIYWWIKRNNCHADLHVHIFLKAEGRNSTKNAEITTLKSYVLTQIRICAAITSTKMKILQIHNKIILAHFYKKQCFKLHSLNLTLLNIIFVYRFCHFCFFTSIFFFF